MKGIWRKITGWLESVSEYLGAFGAAGLFAVALLDSSLVPMPGGADALTILLAGRYPERWPLYAAAAALGSTAGCVVLYYISRRAGRGALSRFGERRQRRVKELIDRYDVLTVLVASVLPPPFPFKLFVISAGVFRFPVVRFAVAIAAGRAFRFGLEAYLAANYGEQAKELFARYYPYIGLGVAALVVVFVVVRNLSKRRRGIQTGGRESET
ncbi:MAG TPA: VTT domain-containing protein [Pyrinomonadaceae bacterium]